MSKEHILGDSGEKSEGYPVLPEAHSANEAGIPSDKGPDDVYNWDQTPANKDMDQPADTAAAPKVEPRFIYWNWQFLIVFMSISFGFYASFLGSITSWSGAQTVVPVSLLVNPTQRLLAPLNFTKISDAANLTTIFTGLNLTQMARGINRTAIATSLDPDKIFWGVVHTDPVEFLSGTNFSGVADAIQPRQVLAGVSPPTIRPGVELRELVSGLNLKDFLPAAYTEFPTGVEQIREGLWVYPVFVFTQILSSVFFGRLSDYIGRRWIFLFGSIVSFVAFIATGRANDGATITGLSALIGIGTGIQIMGPWLALAELVPVHHRFTVTGLCLSLLGPLIVCHVVIVYAFTFETSDGWRWAYYANAIMSFISFAGLFACYFPPTYHQLHNHPEKAPPVKDWLGLGTFTTFIGLSALALGWGKLIWVWSAPQVIAVIVIGGTGLMAFLVYEYNFGSDNNAYPAYLVRSFTHISQMVVAGLHTILWQLMPIIQLIIFLTVTPRYGIHSGWENTWGAGLVGGFLLASLFLARPKYIKWHLVLGAVIGMVFLAALRGLLHIDQYRIAMAFLFLAGLGHGYVTVITYVTAPMTANHRDMGLVVGLVSSYRGLIFAAVRGIFLTLYINQLLGKVQRILPPAFLGAGPIPNTLTSVLNGIAAFQRTGDPQALLDLPIMEVMTNAVVEVLAKSWQNLVLFAYVYFGITMLVSLMSPKTDGFLSRKVFVQLNRRGPFASREESHRECP